jgi:hypothetical protein
VAQRASRGIKILRPASRRSTSFVNVKRVTPGQGRLELCAQKVTRGETRDGTIIQFPKTFTPRSMAQRSESSGMPLEPCRRASAPNPGAHANEPGRSYCKANRVALAGIPLLCRHRTLKIFDATAYNQAQAARSRPQRRPCRSANG